MTTLRSKLTWIFMVPLLTLVVATGIAQNNYKLTGKSSMTLAGTSTLHDWTMTAKTFTSSAKIAVTEDNKLTGIEGLSLVLPVKNLKSSKESMDENAYESLDADKYKDITFKLTSAKIAPNGEKYRVTATGNLTIAGVTRAITMNSDAIVATDGTVTCSGSVALKLSDFNIERPSFVFGTMKVGDALSLSYSVQFTKEGRNTSSL